MDDYSRYVWSRATVNHTAPTVLAYLGQFVTLAEAMHSGHRVSILRSDNGPELVSGVFDSWLKARGIRRELTSAYTANQNGVVERMNRTVVEMGRTMLAAACLPPSFWALAMDAAVYCRNRCPTTSLDGRTPYEAWCGSKPRVAHMRIFGCLAYSHVRKALRGKADAKAKACIFVGYSPDSATYRLWDQHSGKLTVSRDVYFVEGQLGIRAWGATAGSALPASLQQPQLASIDSDSEDDEAPPLVPPPKRAAAAAAQSSAAAAAASTGASAGSASAPACPRVKRCSLCPSGRGSTSRDVTRGETSAGQAYARPAGPCSVHHRPVRAHRRHQHLQGRQHLHPQRPADVQGCHEQ